MNEFHLAHLASFMMRGPSLTIIEATSVSPEGRITPLDCGLWNEEQATRLAGVVAFAHGQGQKIGIQLAHAGRKASTRAPWQLARGRRSEVAPLSEGGWPANVQGPTDVSWGEGHATPHAMSVEELDLVVKQFESAAQRAVRAGVDTIEVHAAHGYLLSSFLSPTSNQRNDKYGGSFEKRCHLSLEVVRAVRRAMLADQPLTFRLSVTEWLDAKIDSWNVEQTARLGIELAKEGVDVLVISSGGNSSEQKVPRTSDYQTEKAGQVRKILRQQGCNLQVGLVGRISSPQQAQDLLGEGGIEATGDIVLAGRQFLKEPGWVLRAANELGVRVQWPLQYQLGRYGLETKL